MTKKMFLVFFTSNTNLIISEKTKIFINNFYGLLLQIILTKHFEKSTTLYIKKKLTNYSFSHK